MICAVSARRSLVLREYWSSAEEGCGYQVVDEEDQNRGGDHGMGGSPPDTLRSAARMVALITAHQGNDKAEYRRLDEARDEIHRLEMLPRAIEIRLGIEAELIDANEIAAENA